MPPLLKRLVLVFLCFVMGCSSLKRQPVKYETVAANNRSDTKEAIKQHHEALKLIEKDDLDRAEERLNKSLIADVGYGPAHNTLGYVHFLRDQFYLAAWEFEYAARLMPDHATPQNNLGLVFEEVGRLNEAAEKYRSALVLSPGDVEFSANLARVRVRMGERTPETATQLNELALRDDRSEWRDWAREQLNSTHLDLLPVNSVSPPIDWPKPVPVGEPVSELVAPISPELIPPAESERPAAAEPPRPQESARSNNPQSKPENYARSVTTITRPAPTTRSNWKATISATSR